MITHSPGNPLFLPENGTVQHSAARYAQLDASAWEEEMQAKGLDAKSLFLSLYRKRKRDEALPLLVMPALKANIRSRRFG